MTHPGVGIVRNPAQTCDGWSRDSVRPLPPDRVQSIPNLRGGGIRHSHNHLTFTAFSHWIHCSQHLHHNGAASRDFPQSYSSSISARLRRWSTAPHPHSLSIGHFACHVCLEPLVSFPPKTRGLTGQHSSCPPRQSPRVSDQFVRTSSFAKLPGAPLIVRH